MKLETHHTNWLEKLFELAEQAGTETLKYYGKDAGKTTKADGSPVTLADKAVETLIIKGLRELHPDIPIVAEEAASNCIIPTIPEGDYFWLVDPIDGTKEFLAGTGDFTINIALIYEKKPIMGVVYAPALGGGIGACYGGKVRENPSDKDFAVRCDYHNGQQSHWSTIDCRKPPEHGFTVLTSKSHGDTDKLDAFLAPFKVAERIGRGSSLKFCLIADGTSDIAADLYPRFGSTMEWDTAAGHAVLLAAGGEVLTMDGKPLEYQKVNFLNPDFIAYGIRETAN